MGRETMTVKLEQYRIFKAIADTGNISRTAKQLYLSQSAVSQSLQQLESALGVRLFSRTARGVTLTAEGSVLYDYAAQALSLLEAGEARIAQSRELLKGELSIGVSSTLTKYYLLPFLRDYHQQYPHIHVRILNGTSRRVLQLLGQIAGDLPNEGKAALQQLLHIVDRQQERSDVRAGHRAAVKTHRGQKDLHRSDAAMRAFIAACTGQSVRRALGYKD